MVWPSPVGGNGLAQSRVGVMVWPSPVGGNGGAVAMC